MRVCTAETVRETVHADAASDTRERADYVKMGRIRARNNLYVYENTTDALSTVLDRASEERRRARGMRAHWEQGQSQWAYCTRVW